MSVLPSFKSAFSSLADAEVSLDVRAADDSGLPAFAATNSIGPHSLHHDRNSPPHWHHPHTSNTPSPRNDANSLPRSRIKRPAPSAITPANPSNPSQPSRPNVAPLPLNLLTDDADSAPAFGFARPTGKRTSLELLPLDSLPQSDSTPYMQAPKVKTASTLQFPTYKRLRTRSTRSVSAGSYVKHLSTSTDRRSRPPPQAANSNSIRAAPSRANPTSPKHAQKPQSAFKPEPVLPKQPSHSNSPPPLPSTERPSAPPTSQPPATSLPAPTSAGHAPPSKSEQVGDSSHRQGSEENKSPPISIQRGPSSSSLLRGNASKTSPLVVSFPPPTFSHRSAGSKANSNPGAYSILQPTRFMEDSTSRAPVDVLGSPKQRSMNSAATAKTGLVPNNSAPIISLSRGPTASDFSHLLAHTRTRQCSDDLVDGTDEITESRPNGTNDAHRHAPSTNPNSSFQRQPVAPNEEGQRSPPKTATPVQHSTAGQAAASVGQPGRRPAVLHAAGDLAGSVPGPVLTSLPQHSPQEPWRQNPQPPQPKAPSYPLHSDELKTMRVISSAQKQYSGVDHFTPTHARPGTSAPHLYPNDGPPMRHPFAAQGGPHHIAQASQGLRPGAPMRPDGIAQASQGLRPGAPVPPDGIAQQGPGRPPGAFDGSDGKGASAREDGGDAGRGHAQQGAARARAGGSLGAGPSGAKAGAGANAGASASASAGAGESGVSGENDGGSVQCPMCPRKLRNQVTLQNHIRVVHHHSGNFQCAQCGLTFMWRSTLGNHVRLVHEKQRPHPCPECGKAFRWKSHLREHSWVVHKGEKPFKCETCGKSFGRKNNMQKHMRKHTEGVT